MNRIGRGGGAHNPTLMRILGERLDGARLIIVNDAVAGFISV